MARVAVFVGSRADLGPLGPVIAALVSTAGLEPVVYGGVAVGRAVLVEVVGAGPLEVVDLAPLMAESDLPAILRQGELLLRGLSREIVPRPPEALVVLGDRWELGFVVPAAFLAGIRVVHLHGGEVTEGALDDRVRHAVSKLADLHCVASADAARRLEGMGEPRDRIVVTGAPGLDRFVDIAPMSDEELASYLGVRVRRPVALFTYHPPTMSLTDPIGMWAREALEATVASVGTVIVTHPGFDPGRDRVLQSLSEVAEREDSVVMVPSLGRRYARILATVDLVVGNSSSGVIEAASVGLPVVNIGSRQAGRLRGGNVIDVVDGYDAVLEGVSSGLTESVRTRARSCVNPYGDGRSSDRVVRAVQDVLGLDRRKPMSREPR